MKDVLLLNLDHTPLGVLAWQRAVGLLLDHKLTRLEDYPGLHIRSPSWSMPWPAVVSLRRYVPPHLGHVGLRRATVLARDHFTCQYCGRHERDADGAPVTHFLTLDHVVPRSQARGGEVLTAAGRRVALGSWENLTTACLRCNLDKGARTPEQAGMPLRRRPRAPRPLDRVRIALARVEIEEPWRPYLPEGTGLVRPRDASADGLPVGGEADVPVLVGAGGRGGRRG